MRNLYLPLLLLLVTFAGYGQGSGVFGTSQVHPSGHLGLYNSVTFVSGYLITPRSAPDDNVYFTTGSTWAGASDASHVNGYAEKEGATAFTFPIGDGTTLRPAGISAPSASGNFQAAYFKVNPNSATLPSGPFPTTNLGTGVGAVSNVEYWDINGSLTINLTLSWNAASNLNTLTSGSLNNLVIVGYNASTSKWESLGRAGGTTGSVAATGTITANAVTPNTYVAFTFGSTGLPDLTPIITARPTPVYGTANITVVVDVYELLNVSTSGTITVKIPKDPRFTLSMNSGATTVNGQPVQNSAWTFTGPSGGFYTATTTNVIAGNVGTGSLSFGLTGVFTPGASTGTAPVTVIIVSGSGGETRIDNNNDAERIDYFQQ